MNCRFGTFSFLWTSLFLALSTFTFCARILFSTYNMIQALLRRIWRYFFRLRSVLLLGGNSVVLKSNALFDLPSIAWLCWVLANDERQFFNIYLWETGRFSFARDRSPDHFLDLILQRLFVYSTLVPFADHFSKFTIQRMRRVVQAQKDGKRRLWIYCSVFSKALKD